MKTLELEIAALIEDPENARTHSDRNIKAIQDSLREFGQVEPLLVQQSSQRVIGGNGRLRAMKLLGWSKVSVVLLEIDDMKAKELGIVLNRTAELAGWNWEQLTDTLEALSVNVGGDLSKINAGFNTKEMRKLLDKVSTSGAAGATPQLPSGLTYSVIVDFETEELQAALLAELKAKELKCRLMIS